MEGVPKQVLIGCISGHLIIKVNHVQNLMRAGEAASLSPLMALARIKPALRALAQSPFSVIPRPHAEITLAMPTTIQ